MMPLGSIANDRSCVLEMRKDGSERLERILLPRTGWKSVGCTNTKTHMRSTRTHGTVKQLLNRFTML